MNCEKKKISATYLKIQFFFTKDPTILKSSLNKQQQKKTGNILQY